MPEILAIIAGRAAERGLESRMVFDLPEHAILRFDSQNSSGRTVTITLSHTRLSVRFFEPSYDNTTDNGDGYETSYNITNPIFDLNVIIKTVTAWLGTKQKMVVAPNGWASWVDWMKGQFK